MSKLSKKTNLFKPGLKLKSAKPQKKAPLSSKHKQNKSISINENVKSNSNDNPEMENMMNNAVDKRRYSKSFAAYVPLTEQEKEKSLMI